MARRHEETSSELPETYEAIVDLITSRYPTLSERFQQIARFFTQNPNIVALELINSVAAKCEAHPSNLVRFGQELGYTGFKQLQAIFQTRLATAAPGFRERINALQVDLSRKADAGNLGYLKGLVIRDIAALQDLLQNVSEKDLGDAARLLKNAQSIYIAGQLRSEPIASFLRYVLTMLRRRVVLLDPGGGLAQEMATTIGKRDVLVAIAFRHYAKEVVAISELAVSGGVPVIAITDSQLSPLAKSARVLFTVPEDEYTFSRTLAAPMCLVQCIAVATAALMEPGKGAAPRIPTVTEIERLRAAEGRKVRLVRRGAA